MTYVSSKTYQFYGASLLHGDPGGGEKRHLGRGEHLYGDSTEFGRPRLV